MWLEYPRPSGGTVKAPKSESRPARSSDNTRHKRPGHLTQERKERKAEERDGSQRRGCPEPPCWGHSREKHFLSWRQEEGRGTLTGSAPQLIAGGAGNGRLTPSPAHRQPVIAGGTPARSWPSPQRGSSPLNTEPQPGSLPSLPVSPRPRLPNAFLPKG